MNLKSYSLILLLYFFSSTNIFRAQISKQEIIQAANSIDSKRHHESELFQLGHSTIEREYLATDIAENNNKRTETVALTYHWRFYPDNYVKIIVYFKNGIPIQVLKEKNATLTSEYEDHKKKIINSLTKLYIFDWKNWKVEKEVINNGGLLLENNISKEEIESIISGAK
ncbi:hypothetical protein SAMN05443633_11735 [Chryseobacterium arachidis]|uniref:Uncharacterized protein n=1 Tax=Chryseobacterium arachidis TaxID=1416778 RepID=A0A1M5KN98_9FLAO|nr:hypothetical protein [Chryseobacterium arachidis]SHG54238.1 hypothetical protein SAMN05443633_11735 [Chryseobacterium arachidis]